MPVRGAFVSPLALPTLIFHNQLEILSLDPVMTLRTDFLGQDVLLCDPASVDHWNSTVMAFLAHSAATPTHLGALLEAEPDFAMGHAVKGMFYFLLGRREMIAGAEEALRTAKTHLASRETNMREAAFVEALDVTIKGSPLGAIAAMERILDTNPEDSLAMKISHAVRFMLGDCQGMRRSIERVLPAYAADHPARGYLLGCHAFALEETGDYAKAETAGRMGLGLAVDDAWGLHAVAHVYDMTGDSRGGLNWLEGREAAWSHCNNFRYHVWWHKALMHLDQGDIDTVLGLYDSEIRKDKTDDYRDISNATSLLSRLELEGVNIGDRWEELADLSEKRTEDGCLIFADLHYLLALTGGKRDDAITTMMTRMRRDATDLRNELASVTAHPGIAAAAGLEAFGEADYHTAYLNLARAREAMPTIGGSHAQRDVFARLTIDAAIRAGYFGEAQRLLGDRTKLRAGVNDRYSEARLDLIAKAEQAAPTFLHSAE